MRNLRFSLKKGKRKYPTANLTKTTKTKTAEKKTPRAKVVIHSDGAVRNNPGGPGGYAAILTCGDKKKVVQGSDPSTTNNRMELKAIIAGLTALRHSRTVIVVTDSNYVKRGMTEWLEGWKNRCWRNSTGAEIANKDLWKELDRLSRYHSVTWTWVKGHSGHPGNEEADKLAGEALESGLRLTNGEETEETPEEE